MHPRPGTRETQRPLTPRGTERASDAVWPHGTLEAVRQRLGTGHDPCDVGIHAVLRRSALGLLALALVALGVLLLHLLLTSQFLLTLRHSGVLGHGGLLSAILRS